MLKLFHSAKGIDKAQLLSVYAQSLGKAAAKRFSRLTPEEALWNARQEYLLFLQQAFFSRPGDLLAVWVENGQYVSALRLEAYQDGVLLEALETAPGHRRKGYASQLIRSVLNEVKPGTKVYAHVDKHNLPSLHTHEACGFRRWKDSAAFVDGTISASAVTLLYCSQNRNISCISEKTVVE